LSNLSGARILIHPIEYGITRSIIHLPGRLKVILSRNGVPEGLINKIIQAIQSDQRFADPLEEAFFLSDGDEIHFRSMTLQAIHCPGHSPGLLCFYWKEKKVLFAGTTF